MFFENVLHHWAFMAIYFVAVVLTFPTLGEFWKRALLDTAWYKRTYNSISELPKPSRWLGFVMLISPLVVVRVFAAPIMWPFKVFLEAQDGKIEAEKSRLRFEREQAAKVEKEQENQRRTEARKQWLAENRPKLYCKTVSGITAVLLPNDYEAAQKDTKAALLNGFWEKENVLRPYRETLVFVTKQGDELLKKNLGDRAYIPMTGWMSQLNEVVEAGNIELIQADDVFVPWVNETLVTFKEQADFLRGRTSNACSYFHLVERQAPKELLPV